MKYTHFIFVFMVITNIFMPTVFGDYSPNWVWDDYPYSDFGWYIAQTPDGELLVVGSRLTVGLVGGCISVFNWQSDIPIFKRTFSEQPVEAVAISDNGSRVAFAVPGMLYVTTTTGEQLWEYNIGNLGYPRSLDFDPSGDLLVLAVDDGIGRTRGRISLFDGESGDLFWTDIPENHGIPAAQIVRKIQISNDSRWILGVATRTQTPGPAHIVMYDLLSPTPDDPLYIFEYVENIGVSHSDLAVSGEHLVVNGSTWLEYHDFSIPVEGHKEPLWEIDGGGYPGLVTRCAISNDGALVAYHGAGLDSTSGHARVFLGSDGTEMFNMETDFWYATVDVSGDGSRVAFSGELLDYDYAQGRIYVYDSALNDILCELHTFGPVNLNYSGESLLVGSGRDEDQVWSRPTLYRLEDNEVPECAVDQSLSGIEVTGSVYLFGVASDTDDLLERVEIQTSAGVSVAQPQGSTLEEWEMTLDLSNVEPGPLTVQARAIDARFKHGAWDNISINVQPTPTPKPTVTPTNTPLATATPNLPEPIYLELRMPREVYQAGDVFWLDGFIFNKEQHHEQVAFYVLLEIHGLFFAAPSWNMVNAASSVDHLNRTFPSGESSVELIPDFIWPDVESREAGLVFYGLILDPQSNQILSNLEFLAWGYR